MKTEYMSDKIENKRLGLKDNDCAKYIKRRESHVIEQL